MTSEVVIRPARMTDYSSVVEGIGDVYWGRDYLPAKYTEFLQDPDFLCFVAEVDGEVVAFYLGELVDNRQTVDKRAGRVKDGYKGQGIFSKLSDTIEAEVTKLGTVKWEVMACEKKVAERVSKGFTEKKGFELIVHVVRTSQHQ
ncbi:histidine N-acetyltransferase [Aplysia californica]|uniref:Histidine N-acetyltransferase n=1 Tax=Aplysia californica TaxID=6500 RepID=A0ABM1VUK8_APLCA|nr:histidine N-acetyltransferase [Aplysia californica]XP_035826100.1 histidine N-acetyltransferase [Aplysia californica]